MAECKDINSISGRRRESERRTGGMLAGGLVAFLGRGREGEERGKVKWIRRGWMSQRGKVVCLGIG